MVDVVVADSQPSGHPQGLLFLGQRPGARGAPGKRQTWRGMGVDAVIAGSVEEADTMDPGSVRNAQGTIQMEHRSRGC